MALTHRPQGQRIKTSIIYVFLSSRNRGSC